MICNPSALLLGLSRIPAKGAHPWQPGGPCPDDAECGWSAAWSHGKGLRSERGFKEKGKDLRRICDYWVGIESTHDMI